MHITLDNSDMYVGSWVVLGKHEGGQYWNPEQNLFVGEKTIINSAFETDPYGFWACKVAADHETSWWRAVNMKLISCDTTSLKVGQKVILEYHDWIKGRRNWMSAKEKCVGKIGTILCFTGFDSSGAAICQLSVSGITWTWRLASLIPTDTA
jgi:hypothetical protein